MGKLLSLPIGRPAERGERAPGPALEVSIARTHVSRTSTEPRHGDPDDYPDIPGDSGFGDEYRDAVMSPETKAAIAERQAAKLRLGHPDVGGPEGLAVRSQ